MIVLIASDHIAFHEPTCVGASHPLLHACQHFFAHVSYERFLFYEPTLSPCTPFRRNLGFNTLTPPGMLAPAEVYPFQPFRGLGALRRAPKTSHVTDRRIYHQTTLSVDAKRRLSTGCSKQDPHVWFEMGEQRRIGPDLGFATQNVKEGNLTVGKYIKEPVQQVFRERSRSLLHHSLFRTSLIIHSKRNSTINTALPNAASHHSSPPTN